VDGVFGIDLFKQVKDAGGVLAAGVEKDALVRLAESRLDYAGGGFRWWSRVVVFMGTVLR